MKNRDLKELEQRFMARQRLDESDAEELRRALLSADGKISRKEANFLVKLREQVPDRTPGFEKFFYKAIRDHLTDDDLFSATEGKWLWEVLFADDKLDERETELLCQLKERARVVNPDFEYLLSACLDARPKQGVPG
jgi:uncharacterized tellurite resistance protein B-like protein